ncbi:FliG C-terminal domain-containing protein [Parvularcula sp. LCG005]|uniref:FliG C-terminal domain-containing protein n=1 Tax=Parvularcula sp. LCG005 TaxID=3078805 RepID=UPI0029422698|nr:FliG C-terminal domain-containing protein [Parvularcula sp. LCG005]WOI52700.1 FliG C-terminal domain-containing protein [Parvularcula sp. LCG005]
MNTEAAKVPSGQLTTSDQQKQLALPSRTPAQKAAAVLALLEPDTLHALAGKLPDHHKERLVHSLRALRSVPQDEQRAIAKEFAQRLAREQKAVRGDEETIDRVTNSLFLEDIGEAKTADLSELLSQMNTEETIWQKVAGLPMKKLTAFFENKPAAILSIALRQLPEETASELAGILGVDMVTDGIVQIATTGAVNPLALEAVEELVEKTLLNKGDDLEEASGGGGQNADKVAGLLNRMTSSRRETVLEALRSELSDDDLAEIAAKVLSFEAIEYRLPRNAIPVVFRECPEKELLTAVKYALDQNNSVGEYLLRNISQRLAAQYRETMESMGEIQQEVGEKAQSTIICRVLELAEEERVVLLAPEDDPTAS